MDTPNILPGQGFIPLTIYSEQNGITKSGRAQTGSLVSTEKTILGMIINASQKEKEQWKQNGHPISHKVISHTAEHKAIATDYLVGNNRQFYIQGAKNPANLDVTMIYYVEERLDIKKAINLL